MDGLYCSLSTSRPHQLTSMLEGCKSIAFMVRLCAAISIASVLLLPPSAPVVPKRPTR